MGKEVKGIQRKRILIVEDSVDFSNLMKFIIEDDGFEGVQFPVDGTDVVDWAKQHQPVAILMDLALRRKTGLQFVDELKEDPETKSIPIIIITGRDLSSKEVFDLNMRGVKYLRKGRVEMEELKREIRESALSSSKKPPKAVKTEQRNGKTE
jgi:two-component system, OmpR family, alkaline phosphatase synthesis response regulator PhoP